MPTEWLPGNQESRQLRSSVASTVGLLGNQKEFTSVSSQHSTGLSIMSVVQEEVAWNWGQPATGSPGDEVSWQTIPHCLCRAAVWPQGNGAWANHFLQHKMNNQPC